jgi:hydroxymethylbilane synthase
MTDTIRIATRKSPLAMWQAEHVAAELGRLHDGLVVEIVGMTTRGDKILDAPLAKVGGKGLFVKELEQGMLEGDADIAVHSMKDVPVDFPEGLHLAVIMDREDPLDAFVSNRFDGLDALPEGACVGTSSLRRQCQLAARRPDLRIEPLRGNVNTRLRKLDEGEYDAIILAAAGSSGSASASASAPHLDRGQPARHRPGRHRHRVPQRRPARATRSSSRCTIWHRRARARRAGHERQAQGGCQVPIAGHAVHEAGELYLRGLVGTPDGSRCCGPRAAHRRARPRPSATPSPTTCSVKGAGEILAALREE